MPGLFDPLRLRSLELANRIVLSPMCQYSAVDGAANDWHIAHYGRYLVAGLGLVFTEATAVSARGRITPACLGLYSDEDERALARVVAFARRHGGGAAIGIQLAHAGRKASTHVPWDGGGPLAPEEGAWTAWAPSAIPRAEGVPAPEQMDAGAIAAVKAEFVASIARAERLGVDVIELHGAHGYLIHSFLSPVSNRRSDGYGGSREARMRFPLELFEAVRAAWPAQKPLGIRISGSDFVGREGNEIANSIAFVTELKRLGCDFVDVSGGGVSPQQRVELSPGYQIPMAEAIRRATGIVTMGVGMITEPRQADDIVRDGRADLVAIARQMLREPSWIARAAEELGGVAYMPVQYMRARKAA